MSTKIFILGGGFGGIRTALDLDKRLRGYKDVQIALVDRNNYQIFYPSLYEVATAYGITHDDPFNSKLRATISVPFSKIFAGTKVETIQAEVSNIDLPNKKISTSGGHILDFEYLVLAFGAEVSTYGIPGVLEYAYKFKTVDDAVLLFEDIEDKYKNSHSADMPIKYLVVGAGFTGIELASEMALCSRHIAKKHKHSSKQCSHITLLEAAPQILPMVSDRERKLIRRRLSQLGIEILENSVITEVVDRNTVKFKDDRTLNADFIIWSAGVKSPEFLKSVAELEINPAGRIIVNDFLQTLQKNSGQTNPHVFAIGDNMIFIPTTERERATEWERGSTKAQQSVRGSTERSSVNVKPVPQMAFLAIKQGSLAAENIVTLIKQTHSTLRKYQPEYGSWVAPVGGKHAVAHTNFGTFSGFPGYLIREFIDARYFFSVLGTLPALKLIFNRLLVFIKND